MKVLIDATSARDGGGLTYVRQVVPALVRQFPQHEYAVLLSLDYQKEISAELPDEVQRITVNLPAGNMLRRVWYLQRHIPRLIQQGGFDVLFTVSEVACIRPPGPSVVLVRNFSLYTPLDYRAGLGHRLFYFRYRLFRRFIADRALRGADRLAFVSEAMRDVTVERMGLDQAKTKVIHHGLSNIFTLPSSHAQPETPYLLAVSTVSPHKDYETMLASFAQSAIQHPGLCLFIGGSLDGQAYYKSLVKQAEDLGIADRVRFLGRVAYEDLPKLYAGATAFVFTSRMESFGQPLVEAMASGIPIVTSDIPASREVCGEAALYFPPGNVTALTSQLSRVLEEDGLRNSLVEQGLQRAGEFSWDSAAAQLGDLFQEAVNVRH